MESYRVLRAQKLRLNKRNVTVQVLLYCIVLLY